MEIIQSLLYGFIQGTTEFLPISSSAHLVLVPYIFNWTYNGLVFDTALHFGTVLAILCFFWKDWLTIIKNGFNFKNKKSSEGNYPNNLLWQLVVASFPAAIVGLLIQDYVESKFHTPLLLAINLAVFGLILWLVDRKAKSNFNVQKIGYKQSFIIGMFQSLALIPGVSRSGITMVASRSMGLPREEAARFSFLLGTPAMVGAFLFEIRKMTADQLNFTFLLSVLTSAIVGFFAIKFLLGYLKKSDFKIFAIYRFILAAIVILLVLAR